MDNLFIGVYYKTLKTQKLFQVSNQVTTILYDSIANIYIVL